MKFITLLNGIKSHWIKRVVKLLPNEVGISTDITDELDALNSYIIKAYKSGDPSRLDEIIDRWINDQTLYELENLKPSIAQLFNRMLLETFDIVRDDMSRQDGLYFLEIILPIYLYAINYGNRVETQRHLNQIAHDLKISREESEDFDKSKSDFISVAAHELKTPLTLIEGYASMILDQLNPTESDSLTAIYFKGLDNGIRRLQEIIDDIIDVSIIDNDLIKLNFQPIWINKLLQIAEQELAKFVDGRSQSLITIDFEGCDQMTYGDPERLYQALRNILTNAIKYTPDGGKIIVDGRLLPGFIEIMISDSGIGIDKSNHEKIFEKFGSLGDTHQHSSGRTKFKGGGPGLGLSITKGLIEAHGGAIWVESEGHDEVRCPGTTFHVLLPFLKEPPDKKIAKLFHSLTNLND